MIPRAAWRTLAITSIVSFMVSLEITAISLARGEIAAASPDRRRASIGFTGPIGATYATIRPQNMQPPGISPLANGTNDPDRRRKRQQTVAMDLVIVDRQPGETGGTR